MSNEDAHRDLRFQIQQRMQFDGPFAMMEMGPGKHGKTDVDGCGVQGVNHLLKREAQFFSGI